MRTRTLALVTFLLLLAAAPVVSAQDASTLDLSGQWRFSTDREETGQSLGWQKPEFDASKWRVLAVPGNWEAQGITNSNPSWPGAGGAEDGYNGYAWYRKAVTVPADWTSGTIKLRLGGVGDADWAYVNGVQIGATSQMDQATAEHEYVVPPAALKPGKANVIAVRVLNTEANGGLTNGPVELVREVPEAAAAPAAGGTGRAYSTQSEGITRIGRSVEVPADMQVNGDVVAIGGAVTVDGHVTGDAVAVGGPVNVSSAGRVDGDATSVGGSVNRAEGATIGGQEVQTPGVPGLFLGGGQGWRWWRFGPSGWNLQDSLMWAFFALLAVLLFPRRLEAMARALPANPGGVALYGIIGLTLAPAAILAWVLLMIFVIVILAITIVGILAIPVAAVAMAAGIVALVGVGYLGWIAVALGLGRALLDRGGRHETRIVWAAFLGLVVLWIFSLVPGIGPLIVATGLVFGFGVALMTGVGTHATWSSRRFGPRRWIPEGTVTEAAAEGPVAPAAASESAEAAPTVEEPAALPAIDGSAEAAPTEEMERPEPPPV